MKIRTAIIIFIISLSFYALPAQANTFVTEKAECNYEIKVNIVFDFFDQPAKDQADFLLVQWQKIIEQVWNNDKTKNFAPGYQANYYFNLQIMAENTNCNDYPEFHCVQIVSAPTNSRGHIADASLAIANSHNKSSGQWVTHASGLNAAHEVGHMMGLGEDYHYELINGRNQWINDNYKALGSQSIMAQTWGNASAFPEHTKQIIQQAGFEIKQLTVNKSPDVYSLQKVDFYNSPQGAKVYTDRINPDKLVGKLIKGESDSAVYLVDGNGQLRWVSSEKKALELFGTNWSEQIIWFCDAIIYTYTFTDSI